MAKKIEIDIVVNGKMQKATVSAKKLRSALDAVDNSQQKTGKSAGTLDRNLKGAAQATSNSTKEFAKMSQGMGGLVAVYAQIAAASFALSAAFQFMKDAMEVRNLMEGQKAFGAVTGVAYGAMTTQIRAATDGMLSFRDAAQAAAIGTAAGLSRGQLEDLGKAAKNVSFALGRDLTDSFNRLVRGVTKAEPELLDELGIVLRLEPALKAYATSIGKSVKDLNQFEKSQAIANDVLEQAETKFAAIEKIMDPNAAALAQFQQSFNDLGDSIKSALADGLIPVFNFLKENTMSLIGALSLVALPIVKQILPNFQAMGEAAQEAYTKATEAANLAASDASQFATASRLASGSPEARAQVMQTSAARGNALGIEMKGKGAQEGMLSKRQMAVYRRHLQDKELLRKKFTKKERAEFRRFMAEQEALLAQSQAKRVRIVKRGQMQIQAAYAKTVAVYRAGQAKMVKATEFAAKGMNAAMKLMGWVGIILLVADLARMLKNLVFPMSEAEKAAEEYRNKMEELTNQQKELNEELDNMNEVRETAGIRQSGLERMTQEAQALQSLDINKTIQQYRLEAKKATPQAKAYAQSLADGVAKVAKLTGDDGLAQLALTMENQGSITEDAEKSVKKYANATISAGNAVQQMTALTKASNAALAQAAGPQLAYGSAITAIQAEIDALAQTLPGLKTELAELKVEGQSSKMNTITFDDGRAVSSEDYATETSARINKELQKTDRKGKTLESKVSFDEATSQYMLNEGEKLSSVQSAALDNINRNLPVINRKLADSNKLREDNNAEIETTNKQITDQTKREEFLLRIKEKMIDMQDAAIDKRKAELTLQSKQIAHSIDFGKTQTERADALLDFQQEAKVNARDEAERQKDIAKNVIGRLQTEEGIAHTYESLVALQKEKGDEMGQEEKAALVNYQIAMQALAVENERVDAGVILTELQKDRNRLNDIDLKTSRELLVNERARAAAKKGDQIELAKTTDPRKRRIIEDREIDRLAKAKVDKDREITELQSRITEEKAREKQDVVEIDRLEQLLLTKKHESLMLGLDEEALLAKRIQSMNQIYRTEEMILALRRRQNQSYGPGVGSGTGSIKSQVGNDLRAGIFGASGAGALYNQMMSEVEAQGGFTFTDGDRQGQRMDPEKDKAAIEAAKKKMLDNAVAISDVNIELEQTSAISDSIKGAFDGMFDALLDGTSSFGDAMKGIMQQLLKDMAKAYMQAAAMKALNMAAMSFGIPGLAASKGGVFSEGAKIPGYAVGGVARGPQSGYPVMMHGTEAVVPLPDGNSIPVKMQGGGNQNNVSVTVNMAPGGQGQTSVAGGGGIDGQELGRSIAGLVQTHLQDQMRPGGLLNRQGQTGRI